MTRIGDAMETVAKIQWSGQLRFIGTNVHGASLVIDATNIGGRPAGVTPMELLLMSLGGCTAIDIVNILKKQRQDLTGLTVNLTGQRRTDHPRYYERIHVEYILEGKHLDEKKIRRAIQLSEEKYCSVRAMLTEKTQLTSSHKIKD